MKQSDSTLELAKNISKGIKHLKLSCPIMKALIAKHPKPELSLQEDHFYYFCRAITYQQLSGAAAGTIFSRFENLVGKFLPSKVLALTIEDMRAVGLSNSKSNYIKNVASYWLENPEIVNELSRLSDKEIISELTSIKGVGIWTVQMFMMFADGRMDVFPTGDLAIRKALVNEYGLKEKAKSVDFESVSSSWKPYRTVASWYLWRSLEK